MFEDVCAQHLWELSRQGALPSRYDRIGGWWRGDREVNLVPVSDDGRVLLGECKWSENPVGTDILDGLVAKAAAVAAEANATEIHFAIWSRAGFTPALKDIARKRGVMLFEAADIAAQEATPRGTP